MQDLLDEKILKKKIVAAMEPKRLSLRPFEKDPALDLHTMTEEYLTFGHRLEQHIADTSKLMWEMLDDGQTVILEGAQGAMLDIDHGTYPFVTSSNPLAGAACVGTGIGPKRSTRSGASRRPTRRASAPGRSRASWTTRWARRSAQRGGEFGTTTGRPRRTGWLDLVALRYAARLNTMTALVITKLDVLSGLDRDRASAPATAAPTEPSSTTSPTTRRCSTTPRRELTELAGWNEDLGECRSSPTCPRPRASTSTSSPSTIGVPVAMIGVGPGREQVIWTEAGQQTLIGAAAAPSRAG